MDTNIAILTTQWGGGGSERVLSILSCNLLDNYKTYLLLYDGRKIGYKYKGELIDLEMYNRDDKSWYDRGYLLKIHYLLKYIKKVRALKREHHIKKTISCIREANIVNILSRTNDVIIIGVHNFTSKRIVTFDDKIRGLLIRLLYNRADLIVVISQGIKNDLIKNFGVASEKITVIYGPNDTESIKRLMTENLEEQYKGVFDHPVIITLGRLTPIKGQIHLIRAFSKIKKTYPQVKLVFIGEGDIESELKRVVKELILENDVLFFGYVSNPFKYIKKSKLFVFPSLSEGFPMALVEAMTCGIPVIASDCRSGPREILSPDTDVECETPEIEYAKYGILVPVCDGKPRDAIIPLTEHEMILADAMTELLKNETLWEFYAKASEQRAEDFSVSTIIPQWIDILQT